MRYLPYFLILSLAAFAADPPEQAKRGKELFALKSASGFACFTCHQLDGEGLAVGPDLKTMGRLHPRAVAMGILATRNPVRPGNLAHHGQILPGRQIR